MVPVRRERPRLAPAPRGSRRTLHAIGSATHVDAWTLAVTGRAPPRVREEHGTGQRLAARRVLAPSFQDGNVTDRSAASAERASAADAPRATSTRRRQRARAAGRDARATPP